MNIFRHPCSWLSPRLESRYLNDTAGFSSFASEPIHKGELVAMWGGTVVTHDQLVRLPTDSQTLSVQVEEDLYLVSTIVGGGDYINHSCNPNVGLYGQIGLVAMRDIEVGEEVCFDYAMTDSTDYDEFECQCGSPECRGSITGSDWKKPEIWDRYDGYFSPYLQRRINNLRQAMKTIPFETESDAASQPRVAGDR